MTPRFAHAIDPIFLYVLRLFDRLQEEQAAISPEEEQTRLIVLFDRAAASLGESDEWNRAKYALVSWIDEILLQRNWVGRDWWQNNVLEVKLFGTRLCYEQFYLRADEALQLLQCDALEVYYNCVLLGFHGIYDHPDMATPWARRFRQPLDLQAWVDRMVLAIRLGQAPPVMSKNRLEIGGAPPLWGQTLLMWSWVILLMLAMGNAVAWAMRILS